MSYAEVGDVKARAGVLAAAWTAQSTPGDAEIELFLDEESSTVDSILAMHGIALPVGLPVVEAALGPVVRDGALLKALEATWPGGAGQAAATELRDAVRADYDKAIELLTSGDAAVVVIAAGDAGLHASSWWDETAAYGWRSERGPMTDPYWPYDLSWPEFHKGQRL